ncbi:MAG: excinuclease ABC subunit UvrA, partial [Proteobacteria bacterium]|nr:excinuclease ABC subunit UvrA [Pseudomonadota bacterium]
RYVESLSAYARQFLELMEKPDVDFIEGLSPAIAIEQKTISKNPRSTVATVTEIYDYLRLLFARVGKAYCPNCDIPITAMSVSNMIDEVMKFPEGTKIMISSPVVRGRKGEYKKELELYKKHGFSRVKIDGVVYNISEVPELNKQVKHDIDIVIDRIVIKNGVRSRVADSVEMAVKLSNGVVAIDVIEGERFIFNKNFACNKCGYTFMEISPRLFSFNNPYGACDTCDGLGVLKFFDPQLVIKNDELSINQGAITPWTNKNGTIRFIESLRKIASYFKVSLELPFNKLPEEMKRFILYGKSASSDTRLAINIPQFIGVIPWLQENYKRAVYEEEKAFYESFMGEGVCPACKGKRLKKEILSVKINGCSISDITEMTVEKAFDFFNNLKFTGSEAVIAERILKEIRNRLGFLTDVGLTYLTLNRSASSLSGGESQRINLATQIGSKLSGVLYVLDEPSIGLHPRDNTRLINTLKNLRDMGNTLLVVEHDEETIRTADWVIDLGPGAGEHGGKVIAEGTPEQIINNQNSLTGQYLSGKKSITVPKTRRKPKGKYLVLYGAKSNNLKNITVKFPLETFICVTGVSGSGKSSLIIDTLYRACSRRLYGSSEQPGNYEKISGLEYIDKVIDVDQSPIGRTPRSNPATYTGVFTPIREVFAMIPEAKLRGYRAGRFSFNVNEGRCQYCNGEGYVKVEMHFLPDVYVLCEECNGKKYNKETLEITYKGRNIYEVLMMTVTEAHTFFSNYPKISEMLRILEEVGLGYIKLGQPATTLSGGEAQRVKLAKELVKRSTGKTLYILDEPTTGLHFDDIKKLLFLLQKLVDMGNTVIVIEHNLDVIKSADWIIDLGPEGGDRGGYIIAEGTPEDVANNPNSYTGQYLNRILKNS